MAEYVVGWSDSSGRADTEVHSYKSNKQPCFAYAERQRTLHLTESSILRGSRVSIKLSEAKTGLPVVMPNPLSKQYTIDQMTLLLSWNNESVFVPAGGSR